VPLTLPEQVEKLLSKKVRGKVHAAVENGSVILSGSVRTFYEKQIAQEETKKLIASLRLQLHNQIKVEG